MRQIFKIVVIIALVIFFISLIFSIKIRNIDIVGNNKVSDAEIVTTIFENDFDRTSLVFFLKSKFKEKENITLVSTYDIEWLTPSSIIVRVQESSAIAYIKRDLKNVYFDKNGVIIEVKESKDQNLVEVIGISFRNYEKGEKIELSNDKVLKAILNITYYLKENNLAAELLEIKNDDNILIYMGNIVANMGNTDNMEVKLSRLKDIYKEISHLSGTLDLSNARDNMLDEQYIFKKAN